MQYEVTLTIKYPVWAVNPKDALTTIPFVVKVRKGWPTVEATGAIKDVDSGHVTTIALKRLLTPRESH